MAKLQIRTTQQLQKLKASEAKQEHYSIYGETGLSVIVSYGGSKVFYYRYTNHEGKQRRLRLGSFPSLSLKDAKARARTHRVKVDDGFDPSRDKALKRITEKKRTIRTVGDLWADYRYRIGEKKKSAAFELSIWRTHLEQSFSKLDARDFNRDAIMDFLDVARLEKSANLANKCQAILTRLAKHGLERRIYSTNPAIDLGTKPRERSRTRVLSDFELREFWCALNSEVKIAESKTSPLLVNALKLILLTLCRRSEVAQAVWSEIDFNERMWVIDADRTKNGKQHAIPLSSEAIDVLLEIRSQQSDNETYVFRSTRTRKSIDPNSVTRACKRICDTLALETFTPHDLRRTGATILTGAKLGHERFIVSKCLNHSDKGSASAIFGVYDRNDRIVEKRRVFADWGLYVMTGDYYVETTSDYTANRRIRNSKIMPIDI